MDCKLISKNLALAIVGGLFAVSAFAQWTWIDKDGRKVFSDRSPPVDIQEKDILKRPAGSVRPAPQAEAAATEGVAVKPAAAVASAAKANTPKLTGKDAELEAKKKKAEDEEAAKRKVEADRIAAAKAENCTRAKTALATLQSGVRMSSVNANGEREAFDDAKRASETARTQGVIDANCGK